MWRLRGLGMSVPEIGLAIGKTANAVYMQFKESDKSYRRQQTGFATQRKCLGCGRPFLSDGIHNRMCHSCKAAA